MPANATAGAIARYSFLDLADAALPFNFYYSRNDTGVVVKNTPAAVDDAPSLLINLPSNPSEGDQYTFADQNGTVGVGNPAVFVPGAEPADTTVGSLGEYPLISPFSTATLTYSTEANDWIVSLGGQIALFADSNLAGTVIGGGNVAPGNITSETPVILWAAEVAPKTSGIFRVLMQLTLSLAAADTVTAILSAQSGLTADVTGGSLVGGAGAPNFRYETGTGGGAVVVPSTTTTAQGEAIAVVPTAEIAHVTLTFAGMVFVPDAGDFPCAIVCTIATTAGEGITAMSLNASVQETI